MAKNNIPVEIQAILDSLPAGSWTIEPGGRHRKIRIGGRMVGILPYGKCTEQGAGHKNLLAQVRRAAQSVA